MNIAINLKFVITVIEKIHKHTLSDMKILIVIIYLIDSNETKSTYTLQKYF